MEYSRKTYDRAKLYFDMTFSLTLPSEILRSLVLIREDLNLHRTNLVNKGFIIWHKEHPRTWLIHFQAPKRKPVICKSEGAFQYSRFLLPSRQINHRKFFQMSRKTFVHPLGLGEMLLRE